MFDGDLHPTCHLTAGPLEKASMSQVYYFPHTGGFVIFFRQKCIKIFDFEESFIPSPSPRITLPPSPSYSIPPPIENVHSKPCAARVIFLAWVTFWPKTRW